MATPTEPIHRPEQLRGDLPQSPPSHPRSRGRRQPKQSIPPFERAGVPDVILIGCGPAAQQSIVPSLVALQQTGALRVRAVIDPVESVRDWSNRLFPDAQTLPSLEALVAPPDSLAILCSPARFHATQSSAAFKRGWHVLAASPLATGVREGAQMIAAAQRQERLFAVDLPHRFFPAAHYLRALCRDHLLGPPISFRIHAGTTRPVPADAPPVTEKFEAPDGALQDLGLPLLDLLTWCLGAASIRSYADDAMGGVEANALLELSFPDNVQGTLHLSRDWDTPQSCTFVFERGIVRWDMTRASRLTLQIGSAPSSLVGDLATPLFANLPTWAAPLLSDPQQARAALLQNIFATMQRREMLRTAAPEAMHSLPIIEECYARRASLPLPWLEPTEAVHGRAFAPPVALRRP